MKLSLVSPSRSIKRLNNIEISDFAIITGINGTGKTHLLKAIEDGSIVIDGIPSAEIVYYNYNDFNVDYDIQEIGNGQSPPPKKNMNKNGSSIVERIVAERTQIINNIDFIKNTPFENLAEYVLMKGHNVSLLNLEPHEINYLRELMELEQSSVEYVRKISGITKTCGIIYDTMRTYVILEIEVLEGNFEMKLNDYFNKRLAKSLGFNRNLLEWSEFDENKYELLKAENPVFNIWEYEGMFSTVFFNFITIYHDQKSQIEGYFDQKLSTLKEQLAAIFDRIEGVLEERLSPEYVRLIKSFTFNGRLLSALSYESGALDLTQIANEEKQYQINKNQNDYNGYLKREKQANVNYLSDEDFIIYYGRSPISMLNDALDKYDCNGYEFRTTEIPNQYGFDAYQHNISISLYHKNKAHSADLESLSSGEKTLLALAFYIYKLKYKRKMVASLLLLDEIDSSLHPSMSKRLINVLHNLFYDELNIKIILSTHSPSTVAFAPDSSLYIMKGDGDDRLFQCSRDVALKELTFGVPSFSINYENRRQIFVESSYDVLYYEALYEIFKKEVNPEISLNFIASGDVQKDKNGGGKSSCDQVITITELLRKAGNKFVWGIVDWDMRSQKPMCDHVKILGWEERYSIENFIFDPLLIAILLMLEKIKKANFFGLKEEFKTHEILTLNVKELQNIIDCTINHLNGELQIDLNDVVSYTTIDGKELQLPKGFMEYQGHSLEEKYLKVFPELNKLKRNDEKALKMEVLNKVVYEYSLLAPKGLLGILKDVQQV